VYETPRSPVRRCSRRGGGGAAGASREAALASGGAVGSGRLYVIVEIVVVDGGIRGLVDALVLVAPAYSLGEALGPELGGVVVAKVPKRKGVKKWRGRKKSDAGAPHSRQKESWVALMARRAHMRPARAAIASKAEKKVSFPLTTTPEDATMGSMVATPDAM
jgi:hypothetical protein